MLILNPNCPSVQFRIKVTLLIELPIIKIKNSAEKFVVFHSDNDSFVQLINGQELAKNLGVNLTFVPNAGHFNTASGYTRFDPLLEKIKEII